MFCELRRFAISFFYMASMGYDRLFLYSEDSYPLEKYPYFWLYVGSTQKSSYEVDDFASMFGIELIPCLQTLAHLPSVLRWEPFKDIWRKMMRLCWWVLRKRWVHRGNDCISQPDFSFV